MRTQKAFDFVKVKTIFSLFLLLQKLFLSRKHTHTI